MLLQTIEALFRKYRLFCYQKLFSAVRENRQSQRDGGLFRRHHSSAWKSDNFPVCRYHRDLSAKCNL